MSTPNPAPIAPVEPALTDKDDVIEFLSEGEDEVTPASDEKEEEPKSEPEEEEEKPEEKDELAEIEEELEGPKDEQLELVTPVRRREILAKYPKLFKDFPYLERAYYREQKFTELLPTIEDAKEAVEKAQVLDGFERDILNGNTESVLAYVRKESPDSFAKVVDNLLPTLYRIDPVAANHIAANVAKQAIVSMVAAARANGNEALQNAAYLLNQFLFNTDKFEGPQPLARQQQQNPEADKLNKEKQEFARQKFESAQSDLGTRINNSVRNTLEAHIDPKSSMSPYVKGKAVEDAMTELASLIQNDSRFAVINERLWKNAVQSNYSQQSLDQIRSAFLAKAKTLLPTVIKKARNTALSGSGKKNPTNSSQKAPLPMGQPSTPRAAKKASDVPRGMSTLDFLNQD